MADLWRGIKSGIRDGWRNLSDKTDELTRVGKLRIEIIAVKRDIEKNLLELGGRVYHLLDAGDEISRDDEKIHGLVAQLQEKEKQLQELEKRIAAIRDQKQPE